MPQTADSERGPWARLQGDYELRQTTEIRLDAEKAPELLYPALPSPTKTREILLGIGLFLAALDLCILPITFYYSLTYGSSLSKQDVFIVIACLFCMMTFAHYTHRCLRLILPCSSRYGPVGWRRKWRLLEFTNVNFAICACIFETIIVIATWPKDPIVRLFAMVPASICYYTGFLFLITALLTQKGYRLPFNMSSTPKGALWRPALLAMLEDTGSIEARCEVAHREAVMRRYESSPLFRNMLLRLTWLWGFGLLAIAVVSTVLIAVLKESIAFGVGWGLPYVWVALFGAWTVMFVKRCLLEERTAWSRGSPDSGGGINHSV